MSTLKRSASVSNIPRLSRTDFRQSNAAKLPRSSSAKLRYQSNTNNNLLSVYGLGTLGRSSSYSSLTTPSGRLPPTTPTSSASKNFRLNDKDWQKSQLFKVKNFFVDYDPEMPPLKPLSIRTYVHSMNILFKQVDNRISITQENYKESVPEYLKSFKYPYNIKPSVVKSPSVPSSWQYVLQIWIWLIELIELLQNPKRVLLSHTMDQIQPKLFHTCIDYLADRFVAFNHAKDEKKVDKEFLDNLAQIQNIKMDVTLSSEDEAQLDAELKRLMDAEKLAKTSIQEITNKTYELRQSNAIRIQNMYDHRNQLLTKTKEARIKSKNIQLDLTEAIRKKEQLQTIISAQICTKAEMRQLTDKIDEMYNIKQLKQQCLKEQAQMIDDYGLKINQQRQMILSIIHKINNKIAVLSCEATELQGLKMPDNMDGVNFKRELEEFVDQIKKIDTDIKAKLDDWKICCNNAQQDHMMNKLKKKELDVKMDRITKMEEERVNLYTKEKEILDEQIRAAESKIIGKEQELEQLILHRPDVNGIKGEYEAILKRQEELKRIQADTMIQIKAFFTFLHNTLKKITDLDADKMAEINVAHEEFPNLV